MTLTDIERSHLRRKIYLIMSRLGSVQHALLAATSKSDRVVLSNELLMIRLELDLMVDPNDREEMEHLHAEA